MSKLPRRPKPAKPPPAAQAPPGAAKGAPPPRARVRARPEAPTPKPAPRVATKAKPAAPRPDLADQLERRLREPEGGAFLHGLEKRVVHPTPEEVFAAIDAMLEAIGCAVA